MEWFTQLALGMKIEIILSICFSIALISYLIYRRKYVTFQNIFAPFLYIFMLRRQWGIKLMDHIGKKYGEAVKLFGLIGIGVGFVAMGLMVALFGMLLYWLFTEPAKAALAPAVPFVSFPGLGFLGFTHWILAIAFLVIVHEFAHGMVARAYGIPIKSSGIAVLGLLAPIFPAAFVEPDEKVMAKKSDVVQYSVLGAGSFMNLCWFVFFWLLMLLIVSPAFVAMTAPTGFSFEYAGNDVPVYLAGVPEQTLITGFNNVSIDSADSMIQTVQHLSAGEIIYLTTIDGQTYEVVLQQHPEDEHRAYVGMINIMNHRDFTTTFKPIGAAFLWFHDLIKWLIIFNLMVGIFNMLPLVITDGGQMFRIAVAKTTGSVQTANKITVLLGFIFGFIILAGIGVWVFGLA
ncbi:MAG: site-2 protease family protein [Candidatus Woesearchaeota archaeon]